jgi:hypothetical protein
MADVQDILIWGGDEHGWISLEGPEGSPGRKATVDVGTTTTGAAGSDAAVVNVGTDSDAVFNFTIPTGAVGPDGEAGTQQVGNVDTVQLTPGSNNSVVINNSGTATSAVWDYTFSLAPGEKGEPGTGVNILGEKENEGELPSDGTQKPGDAWLINGDLWVWDAENDTWVDVGSIQGPPGPDGNAATVSATAKATQVECNESAAVVVTNKGNATAAQFEFAFDLPQGCDGEKGEDGLPGSNAECYVQNGTPTANNPGAVWIYTQP